MTNNKLKNLKVFHGLVNYGTQSGLLARELRAMGFDAKSVTNPDSFKRVNDVELKHGGNFIQKVLKHTWNYLYRIYCFFKYDIFHFYYGTTLLPGQIDLPFYRFFGKKVIMEYLGNDVQGYKQSIDKYKWTNVTYMMTPEQGEIYDEVISARRNFEKKYINISFVCAPIYSEFAPDSNVLPLAVDIENLKYHTFPDFDGTFKIMHAPTHRGFKGTDFIEEAIDRLQVVGFKIDFDLVENVTHSELIKRYQRSHLIIDQIMGGWYGTVSIEAMAIGRPVIVSIRDEYFKYIDYGNKIPAIHADPDVVYEELKKALLQGHTYLQEQGQKCRKFVEEVHDVKKVTNQLIKIYSKL